MGKSLSHRQAFERLSPLLLVHRKLFLVHWSDDDWLDHVRFFDQRPRLAMLMVGQLWDADSHGGLILGEAIPMPGADHSTKTGKHSVGQCGGGFLLIFWARTVEKVITQC